MHYFLIIEFTLFVLAFCASIYMAIQEGFAKKNITLISILLVVICVNSLDMFSVFKTDLIVDNILAIRNTGWLLEVALYLLLYLFLLENRRYKLFFTWYLLFFLAFSMIVSLKLQPIDEMYPSYSFVFGSLGVLIGILLFFYEKLNETNADNIFRNFWFWISAGLFISFASEIPIVSLLNYLLQQDNMNEEAYQVMEVKRIISLFYYLMYLVGILCRKKV